MKKWLFATILLISLLTVSLALAGQDTLTIQVESINYEDAQSIADMLNADRTNGNTWILNSDGSRNEQGPLPALILDPDLTQMAMQRAAEQALCFGHTRPDGTLCFSVDRCVCAENVGAAGYNDPADMYQLLQETDADYSGQGHRRNMYAAKTSHVGIGSVTIDGYTYYAMVFAEKAPTTHYESTLKDGTATIAVTEELLASTRTIDCNVSQSTLAVKAGETAEIPSIWVRKSIADTFSGSVVVMLDQADWASADPTVAAVEGKLVRGVAAGTTELTCNAEGKALKVSVTVEECAHKNATHRTSKEPTRTENGTVTYQCPDCGAEWDEVIPKLPDEETDAPSDNEDTEDTEDIEGSEDTEGTQDTEGPEDHKAQEAAEPKEEDEGSIGPEDEECTHTNAKQVGFKEPTYRATGSITYQCPDCGAEWDEELQKLDPKGCRHENATHQIITEPTCTKEGVMSCQCPTCFTEWEERIPKAEHNTEIRKLGYPCTTLRTREVCKVCGEVVSEKTETGNGHQYTETVVSEANPRDYGKILHHCDVCGHEYFSFVPYEGDLKPEPIDVPSVDYSTQPELPQTVREDGSVYEVSQKVCKHPRMGEQELRTGDCFLGGQLYFVCPDCGRKEFQRDLKPSEMEHVNEGTWVFTYDCGRVESVTSCSYCLAQISVEVLDKGTNHQWSELTVKEAPTETTEGKGTHTCYICNCTENVTIPTLTTCKHEQSEIRTIREATCAWMGEQQKVCVACGEVLETYSTPMTEHVPDPNNVAHIVSSTCTSTGGLDLYCKNVENCHTSIRVESFDLVDHQYERCGDQMVCIWCGRSYPVGCAHEHTHKEWIGGNGMGCAADQIFAECCDDCLQQLRVWNEPGHDCNMVLVEKDSQMATCTEPGEYIYQCTDCGVGRIVPVPPAGHTWVTREDGTTVCSVCGEIQAQE